MKADAEPVGGSQFHCFHVRRPLYKTGGILCGSSEEPWGQSQARGLGSVTPLQPWSPPQQAPGHASTVSPPRRPRTPLGHASATFPPLISPCVGLSYFQDEQACIWRGWRQLRGAVRPLQPVGCVERSQSPHSCASGGPLAPSRGLGVWSRKACRAGSRVAQALSPIIPPPQQPSRQAQSKQRLREAQPPTQGHTALCSRGRI